MSKTESHRPTKVIRIAALSLMMAITTIGCGSNGAAPAASVRGVVKLDGKPVEDGYISFIPATGEGQTAGAKITSGSYTAYTSAVPMRVEIVSIKVTGDAIPKDPSLPIAPNIQNLIPARYNTESQLALIVNQGKNTADFDLESSPNPAVVRN